MLSRGIVQNLFGRFQNLNLLVLIQSLRRGQAARGDWSASTGLCPVAHGLSEGRLVQEAQFLSQADDLQAACWYTARQLGINPQEVQRFVDWWDSAGANSEEWLLEQLERIWQERLDDALAVQEVFEQSSTQAMKG